MSTPGKTHRANAASAPYFGLCFAADMGGRLGRAANAGKRQGKRRKSKTENIQVLPAAGPDF